MGLGLDFGLSPVSPCVAVPLRGRAHGEVGELEVDEEAGVVVHPVDHLKEREEES